MLWRATAGVLAALLLAVGFLAWGQHEQLAACAKKRDTAETALVQLEGAKKLQDAEIERMRLEAEEQQKKAAQALAQARQAAQARQGQIKALQARILAAERSDCGSALQEIREALR